ncbi:TAFII55_N domain-containing protein [Meloidogyne graminicola]|uniref:TAFII55_N domain-containing protein n=1 Tax=Meloidogyne graminicola TaxID=189291 RepID=A0A8S9ZT15_9BILA|nr:TAFII55_N domain-containing protein [Meloidogyne graminicola]
MIDSVNTASTSQRNQTKRVVENDFNSEWENHLIIRFPPEIANKVKDYLNEDVHHISQTKMNINFNQNLRSGTLTFGKYDMDFTLYDLPCVSEVMKTIDKKTIYKVADISQIIICSPPGERKKLAKSDGNNKGQDKYEWPHGICPPMRFAQRKRFRKIKRKKYMDASDVERELKRLLRSDLDSVNVKWEVVSIDEMERTDNETLQELKIGINEGNTQQTLNDDFDYGLFLSDSENEDN